MDLISRQAAIDAIGNYLKKDGDQIVIADIVDAVVAIGRLPSAQPEIIRCNSCKYWTQTTGKMKGYGLGRCDFHYADLVVCNGFCYWAERRNNE